MAEMQIIDGQPLSHTSLQLDSSEPPWLISRTLFAAGSAVTKDIASSVSDDSLISNGIAQQNLDVMVLKNIFDTPFSWDNDEEELVRRVSFETPETYCPVYLSARVNHDRILSRATELWQMDEGEISEPASLPEGMRFIDCYSDSTEGIAVETSQVRYAALSYVWGRPPQEDQESVSATKMPHATIPATIRDAMTVVRKLGIRYLWVDKYCIEESSKHVMISQMGKIYKSALITIVAAAGENPNHGLPGVTFMYHLKYHQAKKEIKIQNVWTEIASSKWSTRAWTFQEGALSPVNLFFTPTQWVLESESAIASDTQGSTQIGSKHSDQGVHYIFQATNEYASRDLTYPCDSLSAFLGVLENWQSADYSHLSGVPHNTKYGRGDSLSFGVFLHGILWGCHQIDLVRVPNVPSWTWAGWRGFTKQDRPYGQFDLTNYYKILRAWKHKDVPDIDIKIYLNDAPYSLWAWDGEELIAKLNENNEKGNLVDTLHITGWSVVELAYSQISEFEVRWDSIAFLDRHKDRHLVMLIVFWPSPPGENTYLSSGPQILVLGKASDTKDAYHRLGRLLWDTTGGLNPEQVAIEGQYFKRRSFTLK
ncbi:hypothetical protein PFICI_04373 [Pestalotiopsis fici W106-1]|uniref:Heterokaryon incompatibility domain-containing protein n=1 Tax=Pestalotiopsis fici (strain W106-1 / CGMCC3.15140) TaxID=1229662 RepID=W3XAP4_PESFW|nr:uncharacterized protein PFICI_04373 [Pestalotiopsis fici W106-1]ETS82497.1 hypothetical protein PFICI_04373 [Pestalotiopsis fici W106-1]